MVAGDETHEAALDVLDEERDLAVLRAAIPDRPSSTVIRAGRGDRVVSPFVLEALGLSLLVASGALLVVLPPAVVLR